MSCTKSIISGNTITGANGSIQLTRTTGLSLIESPQCTNCVVEKNTISGDRSNSIYVISPKNCIITENYITSANVSASSFYAIRVTYSLNVATFFYGTYLTISKNTVDNTNWTANYISAVYVEYTMFSSIEGNIFNEVGRMYLFDCYSANIVGNSFTNMYLYGIYLNNSSGDIIISSNSFTDVYAGVVSYAIYLLTGNVRPVTIVGNSLNRGTKSASAINTYGVFADSPNQDFTNIVVSGNSFKKNAVTAAYGSNSGTVFCYYYEEPSGDRVFLSPSGSTPTAGTWSVGDKVLLASPTAGGYIGYVCTTAGTPGTWKGYGAIQP
jgi:parallel beta-helix repeat protein